jgi:hypothetical protein
MFEKFANTVVNVMDALTGNQGKIAFNSLLTARVFSPIDKSLPLSYLEEHPVTLFPNLYKEDREQRRKVRNKVITTAYVTFLALMHQTETSVIGDFKYHDSGTGTGEEAVGDVGLGTPWGGARSVGTQVASTNTYTSVATTTYNDIFAITEHGLFSASSGVTLMDRSKFAAINVVNGNQIEWTYLVTFTAGG